MVNSRILLWLGLLGSRQNVLIFGASSGGKIQYEKIKNSYNVIGFVDNNSSRRGSFLEKKPIYSPQDIPSLCFDKIIIASCYYQEITKQLIQEIHVDSEKISVFYSDGESSRDVWSRFGSLLIQEYFRIILSTKIPIIANIGFSIIKRLNSTYRSARLKPIHWLDEQQEQSESILQHAVNVDISGPNFFGKNQEKKTVELPAICLTRYQDATIFCTSNSVICNDKLLMWRSPTSDNNFSDYSSGYVVNHGKSYALIENFETTKIERGIAITGSLDVNYFHWMFEVISKLAYIDKLDEKYADYPVLISEKAIEIEAISSFIGQLNIRRQLVYLRANKFCEVGELLTITPPNFVVPNFKGKTRYNIEDSYFTPASLRFIRQTGLAYMRSKKTILNSSEKLFLARKGVFRAYNQDEVWDVLMPKGFETIYLEDMSFAEQIYVMQHAKYIVGPTGAAWTNLVFCEPGTKSLCWMAEEIGDFSCFSHVASEVEVKLDYLLYKTGYTDSRELFYGAYRIDTFQIEKWLTDNQLS